MSTLLRLNQALHGYRDGHRLLQSSIKLSSESQSLLLSNSDATGPAVQHGFDTYLSGFGLPADRVYVIARTWFAHEMERPGCVWTHSLIIDWDVLRDIGDYSGILQAFHRPAQSLSPMLPDYGLQIAVPDRRSTDRGPASSPQLSAALAALYADDRRSIVFASEDSGRWDEAVISIWASQWWTLRRSLTFCTGQLSERPGSRRIDIQVVPQERRFRWRQSDAALIDDGEPAQSSHGRWLRDAERAVLSGMAIDADLELNLRANLPAERSAGPIVLEAAQALRNTAIATVTRFLDHISHRYPEPTSARGLKRALLGENGALWKHAFEQGVSGSELARYVLLSENCTAFDRTELGGHLERIWRTNRGEATSILLSALHADSSEAIEELVRAASTALSESELIQLARSEPGTINALVQTRPALLSQKVLWQGSAQARHELAAALARVGSNQPRIVSEGISAAVEAGAVDSLAELVRRGDPQVFAEVVMAVLCIFPSLQGWQANPILVALRSRATDVAGLWREGRLDESSGTVSLMTVFEPNGFNGRLLGPSLLTRIASREGHTSRDPFECVGPTFALVTALDDGDESLMEPGAIAFSKVHASAARSSLDQWSLNTLERVLPQLGWRRDWDICERLRVAAAERLIARRWPITFLFRLLPNPPEFTWLLRTIYGQRHGRHLLKEAIKAGRSGSATAVQLTALEDVL
jgi:hypothetical protein